MNRAVLLVVLVGFLAIQNVESAPKNQQRPAQGNAPQQQGDIQKDIEAKTQALIKKTQEFAEGNLPDSKQILDKVKEGGENLVNAITDFNKVINEKLRENSGQFDSLLKFVSDKLKEVKTNVETSIGPDGQKKAQELSKKVNDGIKEIATQVGKLGDELKPEINKILDKANEITDDLKSHATPKKKTN